MPRPLSHLCDVCTQVVDATSRVLRDGAISIRPRGQSFKAFEEAAANKCLICMEIWSHDAGRSWDRSWSHEATWRPFEFTIMCPRVERYPYPFIQILIRSIADSSSCDEGLDTTLNLFDANELATSSVQTLDMAYSWLEDCLRSHQDCDNLLKSNECGLPTRLIDIGCRQNSQWKLVISSEDISCTRPPRYMTLSYRWGPRPQHLMLKRSNLRSLRRGQPMKRLPQTFRDLFTVARHFGIRYVWIDSLCIIQNLIDDWEEEASKMGQFYSGSICNVVAAVPNDPSEGLFADRKPEDFQTGIIEIHFVSKEPRRYHLVPDEYTFRHFEADVSNVGSRGWILQERFLSPRLLCFTAKQALWECHTCRRCEGFPAGNTRSWPLLYHRRMLQPWHYNDATPGRMSDQTWAHWRFWLTQFSTCQFTRPSDKLFAFSGVAQYFQEATGDKYLAGLWRSRIIEGLSWHTVKPCPPPSCYRAPSWSWASSDSHQLYFFVQDLNHVSYLVDFIDVNVTEKGEDATTDVIDGFLRLEGYLINVRWWLMFLGDRWKGEMKYGGSERSVDVEVCPDFPYHEDRVGKHFILPHCIWDNESGPTTSMDGRYFLGCLLLEVVDSNSLVFRRIGYLRVQDRRSAKRVLSSSQEKVTVTII